MSFIATALKTGAKYYHDHPARFLQLAGVIGFATSCLCQASAIVVNKQVPAKEKQFLIPQELTDGAVNIGVFLAITSPFRAQAEKWAEKNVTEWLKNPKLGNPIWERKMERILGKVPDWDNFIKNPQLSDNLATIIKNSNFRKGAGVAAYLAGQLIATSLAAPILRNKVGAMYQKHRIQDHTSTTRKPDLSFNSANNTYSNSLNYLNYIKSTKRMTI